MTQPGRCTVVQANSKVLPTNAGIWTVTYDRIGILDTKPLEHKDGVRVGKQDTNDFRKLLLVGHSTSY